MADNDVIAALRKDYRTSELLESQVDMNPLEQFRAWFDQALKAALPEPNAMCLSTIRDNRPESRIVLLKAIEKNGFVFYTNYRSAKGQDIEKNNHVNLNFAWLELERQVRIGGIAEKVGAAESDAYFYSRPFESQLGAIVSTQSAQLESRADLDKAMEEALKIYANEKPIRPAHWGGYLVKPDMFEFWQGRSSRLHDRLRYDLIGGDWKLSRLYP